MTNPVVKDKWTGTNGDPWNPAIWTTIRNTRGSAAAPTIQGNTGRMVTVNGVECGIIAAMAADYADQDITVKIQAVTIGGTYPPDPGMYPSIAYRVGANVDSGGEPADGYLVAWLAMRRRVILYEIDSFDVLAVKDDVELDNLDPHWFRIRVQGSRHLVKWWHTDGAEPPTWQMDVTDDTYTSGRTLVSLSSNDSFAVCELAYDDWRHEEVLPPEPGAVLNQGATVAAYVGSQPLLQQFVGSVEIPVPT